MDIGLSEVVLAFYKAMVLFMVTTGIILIEDQSIYIFPEMKVKAGIFHGNLNRISLAISILCNLFLAKQKKYILVRAIMIMNQVFIN